MSESLILRSASPWFYSQFISAQLLPFRQHPTYENLLFVKRLKLSKYSKQNQLYLSLYHELLQQIIWTLLPVVKSSPPADTWSASCLYKPHMLIKHQAEQQLVLILKASRSSFKKGEERMKAARHAPFIWNQEVNGFMRSFDPDSLECRCARRFMTHESWKLFKKHRVISKTCS